MSDSIPPVTDAEPDPTSVEDGVRFLMTLFDPADTIIVRVIETWTEGGKKKSRTDHSATKYLRHKPVLLSMSLKQLPKKSAEERANLFFGVCPRLGSGGQFDLAWQIRTVHVLWADVDHVTVDEVRERIATAGLPPPSIIVNSGNGAHLYWLLDQPYLIYDAEPPPPVKLEWPAADRHEPLGVADERRVEV